MNESLTPTDDLSVTVNKQIKKITDQLNKLINKLTTAVNKQINAIPI